MLLKRRLLKLYPELKEHKLRFQQDNAPCHRYHKIEEWFNEKDILKLEWPVQSPDMSLIECVWNDLKFRLRGECFSSKDELWKRLKKEWNSMESKYIKELYESMPRRISALVDAEGRHTKY